MGYNEQYAQGEKWHYNPKVEAPILRDLVIGPTGAVPGDRILEVGSGQGFHADQLRILGFLVDACELSKAGTLHARRTYPSRAVTYRCDDARHLVAVYRPGCFALLFSRAMSWFHADLGAALYDTGREVIDVRAETAKLMTLVRPGGCFCLQVATDFSDTQRPFGGWNNTLEKYRAFMGQFGEIIHESDWRGGGLDAEAKPWGGVIITVRQPGPNKVPH